MANRTTTKREQEQSQVAIPPAAPLPVVADDPGAAVQIAMSRQAQEVQAAMLIAKRFPRDETAAFNRIKQSCKRKSLAEVACYEYPRGGQKVSGPSIRLAEVLARAWGNLESGVIELERKPGESVAMAYAWDLETNTRDVKVFTVRHIRDRREDRGGGVELTGERDIYEIIANMGARRKRASILAMIPGDFQDAAVEECEKTLSGQNDAPLADRIRKVIAAFQAIGVRQEEIETLLGHKSDSCTERDIIRLNRIGTSIRDGMSKREDWFRPPITSPRAMVTEAKAEPLPISHPDAKPPEDLGGGIPGEAMEE